MDAAAAVATAARIIIAGDIRDTQIVTGIHGQGCGGDLKPYTENPGDISGVEAVLVVFAPALGLFIRGHQVAELGACFQEEAGKMSIFQQDGKIDIVFMLCYGDIADIGFKPLTGIYQFRLNSKTVTERQPNIKPPLKPVSVLVLMPSRPSPLTLEKFAPAFIPNANWALAVAKEIPARISNANFFIN